MKTIICTNTMPWFSPFFEYNLFEPIIKLSSPQTESASQTPFAYNYSYTLSGFRKKDLTLNVQDNVLTIEGSRKRGSSWWNNKVDDGFEQHFINKIQLSNDMDPNKIKAKFKDDVLNVEIPKKEEFVNYREIPVSGDSGNVKMLEEKISKPKNMIKDLKLRINNFFKNSA